MEGLVRLVAESLARHGMNMPPAPVEWSDWKRLESSLCLAAPSHPGLYSVAERVVDHKLAPEGLQTPHFGIFHEGRTQDLGFEMGRLCSPYSLLRDRIAKGDCWVRFAATPYTFAPDSTESRKPITESLEIPERETEAPLPLPSGF